MANISGESGYVNADVTVIVGGTYVGGGIAGWDGGETHVFNFKMRKPSVDRPRQGTNDSAFKSGVPGPTSLKFSGEGFYKVDSQANQSYPPIELAQDAYVRIQCNTIFDFDMVVLVEKFEPTGDVEEAVKWSLEGESDGIYSID